MSPPSDENSEQPETEKTGKSNSGSSTESTKSGQKSSQKSSSHHSKKEQVDANSERDNSVCEPENSTSLDKSEHVARPRTSSGAVIISSKSEKNIETSKDISSSSTTSSTSSGIGSMTSSEDDIASDTASPPSPPNLSGKVNSVQEACAKCFAVHILKFEILQIT